MIQTKEDYKEYRHMDDARYVKSKHPFLLWLMGGNENSHMRSFMRTLRRLEYYINVKNYITRGDSYLSNL